MSTSKPFILACLAGLLAAPALLLTSCSTATYNPSGLPALIAYNSDANRAMHIYTVRPDGTDTRLTNSDNATSDSLPRWSPDGKLIAFVSNQSDDYEIWTMSEDGSGRRKLTGRQGIDVRPHWSPDGSQIALAGRCVAASGESTIEIFVLNADGSGLKQLTDTTLWPQASGPHTEENARTWGNGEPTWSRDGSKILFSTNRDGDGSKPFFYTMKADGSQQNKLNWPFDTEGAEPDWSPVTNQIVFARGSAAKCDIWVMDGGSPFPGLTARQITKDIDNNRSPVWSPDGRQIAFVSDKYGNDDIFIMDADGSNVRRLTSDKSNDNYPSWR